MNLPLAKSLTTTLNSLEQVHDSVGLQTAVEAVRDRFDVLHALYHWVNFPDGQIAFGTYPVEWQMRYDEKGYVRIDPVVLGCRKSFSPINWKDVNWAPQHLRDFLEESQSYAVGQQGFSIPLHGPNGEFALFTVTRTCPDDDWADFTRTNLTELVMVARQIHQRAQIILTRHEPTAVQLSRREADALAMLAQGLTRAQSAQELQISEHTLRDHIESARIKLSAQNTLQAVARAATLGMIVI